MPSGNAGIDDANHPGQCADQMPNTQWPSHRVRGADRVGRHEHGAECETAERDVPVPGHGQHRVGTVDAAEQQRGYDQPGEHAGNDAPRGDAGIDQQGGAEQAGGGRGFAERTLDLAEEMPASR